MKTLIELFDESQIENIIAALLLKPERIVFVGFKETMTEKRISAIKSFFKTRGIDVSLSFEVVGRFDFASVKKRITEIVERYPDSVFDITGGKEMVIAAMGEALSGKGIPIIQIDVKKRKIVMCENCKESLPENRDEKITIDEIVSLNGGAVKEMADIPLTDSDFKKDIENAWNIARKGCGNWNRQITAFGNFERLGKITESLFVEADFNSLKKGRKDFYINKNIISSLIDCGLIYGYDEKNGKVSFCYKNENVHKLLTKAGNVLEFYAYIIINENPGEALSSAVGVIVDWDSIDTPGAETRNEIDIMLVWGLTPVFISCKNGEVNKEALYELDSVADKFGGEYAKKVLLATYLAGNEEKREYLKTRAKDMGIRLISGIEEMTREEFKAELEKIVK